MEDEKPLSGFVIDEMVWKLGRFLRIAGFFVIIPRPTNDSELASISKRRNCILITRDKDLSNSKGLRSVLIKSDRTHQQLRELSEAIDLGSIHRSRSNCPSCGGRLEVIKEHEDGWNLIEKKIPKGTKEHFKVFYPCSDCDKIYWKGAHWNNIINTLCPFNLCPNLP